MIQEIEIPSNDPLITHFKKLFELHSFAEGRQNVVKITQNKSWFSWCKPDIVDTELPIYINQIKDMMKHFESDFDDAHVEMCYGITNDTITCKKDICAADYSTDSIGKVNICVVYIDVACDGGELVFYNEKKESFKTIQITSCKVVMFEGSVYHRRNDYSKGHRLWVLFQFPRK